MQLISYYENKYMLKFYKTPINLLLRFIGCLVTLFFILILIVAAICDSFLFLFEIPLLTIFVFCFNILGLIIDGGGIDKFHWKDMICDWLYFVDKISGVE